MKKLTLKLLLLTFVLSAFALPSRAEAFFDIYCAFIHENNCIAKGEEIDVPDGVQVTHETLSEISENVCHPNGPGLPVDPVTGERIPFDPTAMGLNAETCSDSLYSCESDYLDCMKDNCEKQGNVWYCTRQDSDSCKYVFENSSVKSDCQQAFFDSQPVQPVDPCEGLSQQECQNWTNLANATPEQLEQLQNWANLANATDAQIQQLQNWANLANATPDQIQQLLNWEALSKATPDQIQQLQNWENLANATPQQIEDLQKLSNCYHLINNQAEFKVCMDWQELAALSESEQEELRQYKEALDAQAKQDFKDVDFTLDDAGVVGSFPAGGGGGCSLQVTQASSLSNLLFLIVGLLPLAVTGLRKK